jgi:polysaccharide pyruvyl transferase WcaK-like protein
MGATRAVIAGAYGWANLGDDALMLANLQALRSVFADEEMALYCNDAPYVSRFAPGIRVIPNNPWQIPKAQLLVYGGGTQFYSFAQSRRARPSLFTRLIRAVSSPQRAVRLLARRITPLGPQFAKRAALGVGIGPFGADLSAERRTRTLFESMDFIAARDADSYACCKDWGLDDRARLGSDLCFIGELWGQEPQDRAGGKGAGSGAAIVIRDWPHDREGGAFEAPLLATVDRLRADGLAPTFFSFSARTDPQWIQRLRARGYSLSVWDPDRSTVAQFVGQLARHDLIVTARYHGAVFAAASGKPVICVEVEPKLRLAAEALDSAEWLWRKPFSAAELRRVIAQTLNNPAQAGEIVARAAQRQRAAAEAMMREFLEFVRADCGGAARA